MTDRQATIVAGLVLVLAVATLVVVKTSHIEQGHGPAYRPGDSTFTIDIKEDK